MHYLAFKCLVENYNFIATLLKAFFSTNCKDKTKNPVSLGKSVLVKNCCM